MPISFTLYYFDPCAAGSGLRELGNDYRLISMPRSEEKLPVWELPALLLVDAGEGDLARIEKSAPKSDAWRIICLLDGDLHPSRKLKPRIFAMLPRDVSSVVLGKTVEMAFEHLRAQEEQERTRRELHQAVADLETLNKIGVALSTERDPDTLLGLILRKSREITYADADRSISWKRRERRRRRATSIWFSS